MNFSPTHIVSGARKYESKLSSWDAEVLSQLVATRKLQMALA